MQLQPAFIAMTVREHSGESRLSAEPDGSGEPPQLELCHGISFDGESTQDGRLPLTDGEDAETYHDDDGRIIRIGNRFLVNRLIPQGSVALYDCSSSHFVYMEASKSDIKLMERGHLPDGLWDSLLDILNKGLGEPIIGIAGRPIRAQCLHASVLSILEFKRTAVFLYPRYQRYSGEYTRSVGMVIVGMGGTMLGGGTSEHSVTGYQSGMYPVEVLANGFPQDKYKVMLDCVDFARKDSTDITITDIIGLCNLVHTRLESSFVPEVQGAVVVTGTDTEKELTVGLSFTRRSSKPIVVASAVRPISAAGTDSQRNFFTAVMVAASPLALNRDIMAISNDEIWPCLSTFKWDINTPAAFSSQHCGALGRVVGDQPFFSSPTGIPFQQIVDERKLGADVPRVALLSAHVGFHPSLVRAAINEGFKAIVFAGFGKGFWGPDRDEIKEMLDQSDVLAFMSHQGCKGWVEESEAGFGIPCGRLLPREVILLATLGLMGNWERAKIQSIVDLVGFSDGSVRSRL
ncbi:hypothetical protein ACJZ2D_016991 [Fusarium nematophilum]